MNFITESLIEPINNILWGSFTIILIVTAGSVLSIGTGFFQIRKIRYIFSKTFGSVLKKGKQTANKSKNISQFQAFCTSLGSTIGTGNIIGVTAAISVGGPGAVFWMWISAFFSMIISYAENVLAVCYRTKSANGEWCGGPMYYLKYGLSQNYRMKKTGSILACTFAVFCVFASFGTGNITQISSISSTVTNAFGISRVKTGFITACISSVIIIGGVKRLARLMEKLVPFMAVFYLLTSFIIIFSNRYTLPGVLTDIISNAFGLKPMLAGSGSAAIMHSLSCGFRRGIFSNEAGLGSTVIVNSVSDTKEPVEPGMWGIMSVFTDTVVVSGATALAVLSCYESAGVPMSGDAAYIVQYVFFVCFGKFATGILASAIILFAFTSLIGWSYYGIKAWEYLFREKTVIVYKIIFVAVILIGSQIEISSAWDISDMLNGFMMITNITGILMLSGKVSEVTSDFKKRNFFEFPRFS